MPEERDCVGGEPLFRDDSVDLFDEARWHELREWGPGDDPEADASQSSAGCLVAVVVEVGLMYLLYWLFGDV